VVITHTVAQVFRVENVVWPASVRRNRDHVSGPFYVFVLFFQANCECLSQLQFECESVDVLEELKALCVFDTITALIRSLKLYGHGSAVLHTD